jgi:hypothetical protein
MGEKEKNELSQITLTLNKKSDLTIKIKIVLAKKAAMHEPSPEQRMGSR